MGRRALRAVAGDPVLLHPQQPLDLGQLGVAFLQQRRATHEHVETEVVADRHLVGQAAQVPVQLGDLLGQSASRLRRRSERALVLGGPRRCVRGRGRSRRAALAGSARLRRLASPSMLMPPARFDHVGEVLGFFLVALALCCCSGFRGRVGGAGWLWLEPAPEPPAPGLAACGAGAEPPLDTAITVAPGKLFFRRSQRLLGFGLLVVDARVDHVAAGASGSLNSSDFSAPTALAPLALAAVLAASTALTVVPDSGSVCSCTV